MELQITIGKKWVKELQKKYEDWMYDDYANGLRILKSGISKEVVKDKVEDLLGQEDAEIFIDTNNGPYIISKKILTSPIYRTPEGKALLKDLRDIIDLQMSQGPTLGDLKSYESYWAIAFKRAVLAKHKETARIKAILLQAIKRIALWKSPLFIDRMLSTRSGDADTISVGVGKPHISFTFFLHEDNRSVALGDILEGGDTDFFRDPVITRDYFNLVKELQHPGSTSRGKNMTLYTARPVKDRDLYLRGKSVPPNIFLANRLDHVIGLAEDLGGKRDIWKVVIDSRYLVETLETTQMGVGYYQTVGDGPIPVVSTTLYQGA